MSIFSTLSAICCFNLKKNTDALLQFANCLSRNQTLRVMCRSRFSYCGEHQKKTRGRGLQKKHQLKRRACSGSTPCRVHLESQLVSCKAKKLFLSSNTCKTQTKRQSCNSLYYSTHACCLQHSHNGVLSECCSKLIDF